MNYQELEHEFFNSLQGIYPPEELQAIFGLCLESVEGLSRMEYRMNRSGQPAASYLSRYQQILSRLLTNEPIQYILGQCHFYNQIFTVGPGVLIPRQETEELVRWIADDYKMQHPDSLLDVGTGSGCIAITLKSLFPASRVLASDISLEALRIASLNQQRLQPDISLIQDDMLQPDFSKFPENLAVIVSNPPYIQESERALMLPNVLKYEPSTALFVPNEDALKYYRALLIFAQQKLAPCGRLYFEINENLGHAMLELCKQYGFSKLELRKDLMGKDRMIRASVG